MLLMVAQDLTQVMTANVLGAPFAILCPRRFWRNMYHQFDRSMHPRQSVVNTILTLREKSQKAQSTLQALEDVSDRGLILFLHLKSVLFLKSFAIKRQQTQQNCTPLGIICHVCESFSKN